MQGYSLLEAVYSKADPLDLIDPTIRLHELADRFWQSPYGIHELDDFAMLQCEGDLLLEFSLKSFVKDNLLNVLQAGIGTALEGGISIGTLGAGAPAGVFAEFMNDAVFFGISAGDMLSSLKGFFTDLGELKDAVKAMVSINISNTPQQIYDKVKDVINKLGGFFKKLNIPIEKGIEKFKEIYRKLMTKMAKVVGDVIGMFSPIPGTDAIVQNGITEFADEAFKLLLKVYDKLPDFLKEYMQNPKKMLDTMMSALDAVVKFVSGMAEKPKGMWDKAKGALKKMAITAMGPIGQVYNLLKSDAVNSKIVAFLKDKAPKAIEFVVSAVKKLIPIMWGAGSALTIFVNDDHDLLKEEEGSDEDGDSGADAKPKEKSKSEDEE